MPRSAIVSPLQAQRDFMPHLCTPSRAAWRSLINAAFGQTLNAEQQGIYETCTGRVESPSQRVRELYLICGRGAGKSEETAFLAVYLSCFFQYEPTPGEELVGMCLAADRRQARIIMRYIKAMLKSHPLLEKMIARRGHSYVETAGSITLILANGHELRIEVHTANFRSVRGYTVPFVLCDEIAFWRDETSANPDEAVLSALRPAMGRPTLKPFGGGMLICLSSPYAQKGALFNAHKKHYGQPSDRVLVWKADTLTMNPEYDGELIAQAYADDEVAADCEYGANFHADVQALFDPNALAQVTGTTLEREPAGHTYRAFVDPAGGSGGDSMTLAIAHTEDGREVVDAIRERKPKFNPDDVTKDFADLLKLYRVGSVTGDRYAGEWPRERFRAHQIDYALSERNKSEIYKALLPVVNSNRCELLEHAKLKTQLSRLERRTGRGGKDSIDHPPGQHDDVANVVAGVIVEAAAASQYRIRVPRTDPVQQAAAA